MILILSLYSLVLFPLLHFQSSPANRQAKQFEAGVALTELSLDSSFVRSDMIQLKDVWIIRASNIPHPDDLGVSNPGKYCIVHYTVLYCTILYYTVLHYTVLLLYFIMLYYPITVLYNTQYTVLLLYCTIILYYTLYCSILCSILCTVQYSTVP